jgi:DNA-binding NarL/FixJ family response regulator
VVSDILMPDMDGETFLRAIRSVPGLEHTPFVTVSAVRSEARIKAVLDAGADAFLLKPFPLRELLDKVRSLLERKAPAAPEPTSDYSSPTRPVFAAPTTSMAVQASGATAAPMPRRGAHVAHSAAGGSAPGAGPAAPHRGPGPGALAPRSPHRDRAARGLDFGRFTVRRAGGRSWS